MNAKERLRLYLEQRRELGETELTLDALPVDDVLRVIGAPAHLNSSPWRDALAGPPPTIRTATPIPEWLVRLELPIGLSVTAANNHALPEWVTSLESIESVAAAISTCRRCPLGATALNPVPGEGSATADFVCVGEAPGASEDETGRPFVGAAGQLLTKILAAIQLERSEVFICNVLKHRPPMNRNPAPDEIQACAPYLVRQLALLKPKVILALGTFAAQTLLETPMSIGKLRGQIHRYRDIPLIVTYHPSALLRNEAWKRPAWDDVKLARRILDAARLAEPAA